MRVFFAGKRDEMTFNKIPVSLKKIVNVPLIFSTMRLTITVKLKTI